MEYLRDQGFTQTDISERTRAWLQTKTTGNSPFTTEEEMWLKLGIVNGYAATTVNEIQKLWANGVSGNAGSWNDAFDGLPGYNLITNGNFLVDALGWVLGAGWTSIVGFAVKAAGSTADASFSAAVPVPGETYRITATYTLTAGILYSRIGGAQSAPHTVSGTYTDDIVALNATPAAIRGGSTAIGTVTNISVRRIS